MLRGFPYLKPLLLRPSIRHNNVKFHRNCSIIATKMENGTSKKVETQSRGALVVLEGLDRSGKSSQCSELLSHLKFLGYPVELWRYPDRNTAIGEMISAYLSNQSNLDDHTIHLFFSANRREKRSLMEDKLKAGITLIVDRYSYSGVAFSSAKGLDFDWCKAPEMGLLAPDMVLYLDISPEKAAERGGYGDERYERLDFQGKVREKYKALSDASWKVVMPACQWKKSRRCSENMCLSVSQNAKMERLSLTFGYISPDCLLDFVQIILGQLFWMLMKGTEKELKCGKPFF